jgi:hypothetical protein
MVSRQYLELCNKDAKAFQRYKSDIARARARYQNSVFKNRKAFFKAFFKKTWTLQSPSEIELPSIQQDTGVRV